MRHRYTVEEINWIKENYPNPEYSCSELVQMFNHRFNSNISIGAIKRKCRNLGVRKPSTWYTYDENLWIVENAPHYSALELCKIFNNTFNRNISISTMYSKCSLLKAKLNCDGYVKYTNEQAEWLLKNYPLMGVQRCTEEFNRVFKTKKTNASIRAYCNQTLKLHVNNDIKSANLSTSSRIKYDIGYEVYNENLNYISIKIDDKRGNQKNWVTRARYNYMKFHNLSSIPKGYNVIHLDGNTFNDSEENLYLVSKFIFGVMVGNGWLSISDKNMKLTAIKYCELYEALRKGE